MTAHPPGAGRGPTTEALYRSLRDDLFAYLIARTGDRALAEDLLHDAFVRLHRRSEGLADVSHIRGFVFQVVRSVLVDHMRRQASHARRTPTMDAPDELAPDLAIEPPAEAMLAASIGAFIDALPPADREALRLVEFEGLNQRELADRLGISRSGARSRVQRARRKLTEALEACCAFEVDRYGQILEMRCRSCETDCAPDASVRDRAR